VIFLQELEMNDISGSRKDSLGIVKELSGTTNVHKVLLGANEAGGKKSDGSSSKQIVERFERGGG